MALWTFYFVLTENFIRRSYKVFFIYINGRTFENHMTDCQQY